jgi:2-deoxy-D-gluconate 3-dehydrogenase
MILDQFSLRGRNALVTGSRTGLGAAIALAFAEAGANVAINSRGAHGIADLCAAIEQKGVRALHVAGDVTAAGFCQELVNRTVRELGSIDILVNNAGTMRRAPAEDYPAEDWAALLDVHLTSVFRLCQLAGRHMLAQGRGKIINIASLLSFQGGIRVPAYAAAKGGVAQLTKALANEWAARGVNVNAIAPGYMITDNTTALRQDDERNRQILERIPAGRWGSPGDLAGAAVFLASAASDYVHGQILAVDGGWLAR